MPDAVPPRRPRNPRGEGQRLREDVLVAARALLEESGSEDAVTMRAAARRAGVTATALYRHFDSREVLVQAAVGELWRDVDDVISTALASSTDPGERLRRTCGAYVGFGHERAAAYRVLFSRLHPSPVPEVGARAATLMQAMVGVIEDCGTPRASAPAAALAVWMTLHGLTELPPSQPRFPWPQTDDLLDAILQPYLP